MFSSSSAVIKTDDIQSSQADQSGKHFVVNFLDDVLGQVSVVKKNCFTRIKMKNIQTENRGTIRQ